MKTNMIYEHRIQFIPKGVNPHSNSDMRTVNFCKNIRDKSEIEKLAYYEADKQNIIDEYSLRNHWNIFDIEINYYNKPWDNWTELCRKLMSFSEVKSLKNVENRIYVYLKEDTSEKILCNKIENYYSGFLPVIHSPHIIRIESKPEYYD